MKKQGILNAPLCGALAELGHYDTVVVCDAGLPIPKDANRIDLALIPGVPGFLQTVTAIVKEIDLEEVILAEEVKEASPEILTELRNLLGEVEFKFVPHTDFKKQAVDAKFFVRTGEVTSYANIILVSGVKTLFSK